MGHRNMLCHSQLLDLEISQQGPGHHDSSVVYGSIANFPSSNVHTLFSGPGMATNIDSRHFLEHHDGALLYGMTQYNGVPQQHPATNHDLSVATGAGHCNLYPSPSNAGAFPQPGNHGPCEQPQLPGNHEMIGVPTDTFGRNHYFKRKTAEGILGNFPHFDASGGSSSSVTPLNARSHVFDFNAINGSSLPLPEYRGNSNPLVMEVGSHRIVQNRCGGIGLDPTTAHNPVNHLIQGSYLGQPVQTAGAPWSNQQFNNNAGVVGDIGPMTWNQTPALSYVHGNSNGGCVEVGNIGIQGYQVPASIRNSGHFGRPPFVHHGHPNLHHPPPPPPIQGLRGQNMDLHPQVATSTHRVVTNGTPHPVMNTFQDALETGSRFVTPVPPSGFRIYRPHQRGLTLEPSFRQRNFPQLRVLPEEGVAILEIPGYLELGDSTDQHRDMRLDIDHMTYEELLALGEQIGSVDSGLSEETIGRYLKTRTFSASSNISNQEETTCADQEIDFCVICQANYKHEEKIGTVACGHEYHVDCINKWLLVKNSCPICKATAVPIQRKEMH